MKRPGRPALARDDPSVAVTVRLPSSHFDAAYHRAKEARLSMSEWLRQVVERASRRPARGR